MKKRVEMYRKLQKYINPVHTYPYGSEIDYDKYPIKVGDKVLFFIEQLQWYKVVAVNKNSFRIQRKIIKNKQEVTVNAEDIGVSCFFSLDHFRKNLISVIKKDIKEYKQKIIELKELVSEIEDDN